MTSRQVENDDALPLATLAAYGSLAFPMAAGFIALQVIVPTFYAQALGLSLSAIGGILLVARLWDMITDPVVGFQEMRRLLKPGGRAGVLDFNRLPEASWSAAFQRLYLRRIVVPAAALADLEPQYSYLEDSLKRFATGPEQEAMALEAGFQKARHRPLVAGQMGLLLLES